MPYNNNNNSNNYFTPTSICSACLQQARIMLMSFDRGKLQKGVEHQQHICVGIGGKCHSTARNWVYEVRGGDFQVFSKFFRRNLLLSCCSPAPGSRRLLPARISISISFSMKRKTSPHPFSRGYEFNYQYTHTHSLPPSLEKLNHPEFVSLCLEGREGIVLLPRWSWLQGSIDQSLPSLIGNNRTAFSTGNGFVSLAVSLEVMLLDNFPKHILGKLQI